MTWLVDRLRDAGLEADLLPEILIADPEELGAALGVPELHLIARVDHSATQAMTKMRNSRNRVPPSVSPRIASMVAALFTLKTEQFQ